MDFCYTLILELLKELFCIDFLIGFDSYGNYMCINLIMMPPGTSFSCRGPSFLK
ncbi:hypothetical protein RchiOBHm_Chr2g0148051 [Rosa chinensis]|uniref:Uncharacterized protein n=1 Tax=Rosa chinensis TaxID=74649 RepID=A0A2P6RZC3_ROSCH|nr:hypothetical protein RchiOBHm_Chr2g0148051 [Rosa chinensis]